MEELIYALLALLVYLSVGIFTVDVLVLRFAFKAPPEIRQRVQEIVTASMEGARGFRWLPEFYEHAVSHAWRVVTPSNVVVPFMVIWFLIIPYVAAGTYFLTEAIRNPALADKMSLAARCIAG